MADTLETAKYLNHLYVQRHMGKMEEKRMLDTPHS